MNGIFVLISLLPFITAIPPPGEDYPEFPEDFHWSSHGPVLGMDCLQIKEPSDPHTWDDNYLCWVKGKTDPGLKWSHAGIIPGERCTMIYELSDQHTWLDNFLCTSPLSPYHFSWSSHGPIPGLVCLAWDESSDPHTWDDNYLCASKTWNPN